MQTRFSDWWRRMVREDRGTLVRMLLVGALGVGLLAFSGLGTKSTQAAHGPPPDTSTLSGQEQLVAGQIRTILQAIPQVGPVSVAVTLDRTIQSQYVTSTQGLTTPSSSPVVVTNAGGDAVVPLDQVGPLVAGVVVVAPAATNPNIRSELAQAVETLLQVQPYQVLILPN